jgi:hypothetical protein
MPECAGGTVPPNRLILDVLRRRWTWCYDEPAVLVLQPIWMKAAQRSGLFGMGVAHEEAGAAQRGRERDPLLDEPVRHW